MTEIARSTASFLWDTLRQRALTIEELADACGVEVDYTSVTVHRMVKRGIVKPGPMRGTRRTYTSRGIGKKPAFYPQRGAVQEAVYSVVKKNPGIDIEGIAEILSGTSLFGVRNSLTRLQDRGLVTSRYEGRKKVYEVTKHGKKA